MAESTVFELAQIAAHAEDASLQDAERAVHATALAGDPPEWVQLLPAGTFRGFDGRGPYTLGDAEAVIARSRALAGGHALPIDYDHALEAEGHGTPAPASGWITQLEVRGGEIWGRVEWTEAAAAKIRGREYRFLSPVFFHDREGRVLAIARAGLTNKPNLPIKSLNAQSTQPAPKGEEKDVSVTKSALARISAALGLQETEDAEAILARCTTLVSSESAYGRVAESLSLARSATAEEVIQAVQSRLSQVEVTKYVPREQFDQVSNALKAAQAREGERAVDEAIEAGKLIPAQREWALAYHARDAQGFATFVAAQPVIVAPGTESGGKPPASAGQLDADAKAVCAALGVSPEEFIKNQETR